MTTASNRIRRSVQYAKFDMKNMPRVEYGTLQRERMSVSGKAADLYPNSQDWTGSMGTSPSGRFMVLEEPVRKTPLLSGDGIRNDAAKILIAMVAILFAALLLADAAAWGRCDSEIRRVEQQIVRQSADAELLKSDVSRKTGDVKVCTEAVKLNMISSNGAKTIVLDVPGEAGLLPVNAGIPEAETESLRAAAN